MGSIPADSHGGEGTGKMKIRIWKTAVGCAAATAFTLSALELYPEGVLNQRIPSVPPAGKGASGLVMHLANIDFVYPLLPHLRDTRSGTAVFFVRDILKRGKRDLLVLSEQSSGRRFALTIPDSPSEARVLQLSGVGKSTSPVRFPVGEWKKVTLKWEEGRALLTGDGLPPEGISVKLPSGFAPDTVTIRSPYLDEFQMTVPGGTFSLDWERDYRAVVRTKGTGGRSIRLFGFDSRVAGPDPSKRDAAMVCFSNSTNKTAEMTVHFRVYREIADQTSRFSMTETVPPDSFVMRQIRFPFSWSSDICHLYADSSDTTVPYSDEKHYLTIERRNEPAGPGVFGIHDSNIFSYGWWPDALPFRYTHKYIRWSFVMGPNYSDSDRVPPSQDPSAPPEEWNWDDDLDWLIAAGNEIYCSIQSYPTSKWYRTAEFERGMRIYPHGVRGGGMPDLKKYARFLRALALRYRGQIFLYEIENEPMAYGFRYNPEAYAEVVKTAVPILKGADPRNFVYGICGTSYFVTWMSPVTKLGATRLLDGLSIHTYTSPRSPDDADLDKRIREHRNAFPDGQRKPLFNSETGVNTVNRYEIERPIPPAIVVRNGQQRMPGFHSKESWPGPVADEFRASRDLVENAVINFLEGARAFTFFFWDDPLDSSGRKRGPWTKRYGQFYNLFASTPDHRRTPSRSLLAGSILAAQLEGLIPERGFSKVNGGHLRGGIFSKANGGRVAVLWSRSPGESVLVRSSDAVLERVSMYGKKTSLRPVARSGNAWLYAMEADATPFYLHSVTSDLQVMPSPVSGVRVMDLADGIGRISLELLNSRSEPWIPRLRFDSIPGLELRPSGGIPQIPPKRHGRLDFLCSSAKENGEYWVRFRILLPEGGEYVHPVRIRSKKVMFAGRAPESFSITGPDSMNGFTEPFRIHTAKQCQEGRPPEMMSFHSTDFWGGENELSAEARLAFSGTRLFCLMKVRDASPRLPEIWPGVLGSAVELFLDLRPEGAGLGSRAYGKGVFQILFLPALEQGKHVKWSSRQLGKESRILVCGEPLPGYGYWVGIEIPLELLGVGMPPERFGADFAVNGPFADRPGRKTQMFGFGGGDSWRNAEHFGTVLFRPERKNKK